MTIKEIAEICGVSPACVSLVLNNKPGVSEETRSMVKAALLAHDYAPFTRKAGASKGRIRLVKYYTHGMVVEENQGFIAAIIDEIEAECRRNSYSLAINVCNPQTIDETLRIIHSDPADGMILIGTELDELQTRLFARVTTPMVVLDNGMYYAGLNSVVMANEDIVGLALEHLYVLGHREIAYLHSSVAISNFVMRARGYHETIERLGQRSVACYMLRPTFSGAYEDMKAALVSGNQPLPSALFADNDTIAIGAVKALLEAGYRIPQDVSIIGVDDIPTASILTPALTTIAISRTQLGQEAMALLCKCMASTQPPVRVLVGGQLIVRESTAEACTKESE